MFHVKQEGEMRVGVVLGPVPAFEPHVKGTVLAEELGFEAVGFWDHYQSPRPEWGYVCGWTTYGFLAARTRRVRFVPMVLNNLHYDVGVLAKESSMLALASGGRFELGIGAGDWPESYEAWGQRFPERDERLGRLEETALALRQIWGGQPVTFEGRYIQLHEAICTPAPAEPPRIVVGVAKSPRTLASAVRYADEINIYADEAFLSQARDAVQAAGRDVAISMYLGWELGNWPADPETELRKWRDLGVERLLVSLGGDDTEERIRRVAAMIAA